MIDMLTYEPPMDLPKPRIWVPLGLGLVFSEHCTPLSRASVAERKLAWRAKQHPKAKRYERMSVQEVGDYREREPEWSDVLPVFGLGMR